jgi:hypothetical protein
MITENRKIQFLKAPWDSPLVEVPGVGAKTAEALKAKGITTLYQLAGVFLTFKGEGVGEKEWCDKMWEYLAAIGEFLLILSQSVSLPVSLSACLSPIACSH